MHFGLGRLGGSGLDPFLERRPIRHHFAIPIGRPGAIDVDLDDLRQDQGWRRIAGRHVEIDRMQLDRQRDDEHDQQHQHDVDQRRRVDVDHDLWIARYAARTHVHCHGVFLK
jgi:hypothetical protein